MNFQNFLSAVIRHVQFFFGTPVRLIVTVVGVILVMMCGTMPFLALYAHQNPDFLETINALIRTFVSGMAGLIVLAIGGIILGKTAHRAVFGPRSPKKK